MRIAIDCRLIGFSGIGTFIENVLENIVHSTSHSFVLIGNHEILAKYQGLGNCKIVVCNHKPFSLGECFGYPIKEVNQCDAYYTPNFNIPRGIKVPIFSTIHDVVFFDVKDFCPAYRKLLIHYYIKRALKISHTIFTVSDFSKQRIQSLFHTKADIKVVYNGISKELAEYKLNHQESQREDYIIFLGNLKKHKGIHILIDAYEKLLASGKTDYKLIIVGRFDFRSKDQDIIRLLRKQDENGKIVFIHDADNQKVYKLLSHARALVSPSLYEGFGIPPLEAMYLGTPVIISDIPVYKEIYAESPACFFKSEDSDDLLRQMENLNIDIIDISQLVNSRFNYKSTAYNILKTIDKRYHNK